VKFLTAQIALAEARARRRAALLAEQAPTAAGSAPTPAAATPTPAPQIARTSASVPAFVAPASSAPVANVSVSSTPTTVSPPSSTPPASEAHDHNSVAAIELQRVYSPDPEFPEAARERDLTGYVDLEFTVRSDGSVTDVTVLKARPLGIFEKAAVAAVSRWRYRPFDKDGVAVEQRARLRLNFAYK
jgi:protein TonB